MLAKPYQRVVTVLLAVINLIAIAVAIEEGGPGQWDLHFQTDSIINWLSSAQMVGASVLFLACFFTAGIVPAENGGTTDRYTWLLFSLGFFALALDQEYRLRDFLTTAIDGVAPTVGQGSSITSTMLKVIPAALALVLVVFFRRVVLANFNMVLAFFAGFWFLLCFLLVNILFEGIGMPDWAANILEGASKLMAMAMFLSAAYAALLEQLKATAGLLQQERFRLAAMTPRPTPRELQVPRPETWAAADAVADAEAVADAAAAAETEAEAGAATEAESMPKAED